MEWSPVRGLGEPEPSCSDELQGRGSPRVGASQGHRKDPRPSFLLERRAHRAEAAVWVQASSWG